MDHDNIVGRKPLDLETLSKILKTAKIPAKLISITPLAGGANNRVLRLDLENSPSLVLKSYFQHPNDPRPRLKAEFEFLEFAWSQGIRSIPQPLYQDPTQNLAIYSYIDASLANANHSNGSFVKSAIHFIHSLNRGKARGEHLLHASEPCLDPTDYFLAVEKRLDRLLRVPQNSLLEKQLHVFLQKQLLPRWIRIKEHACKADLHPLTPERADLIITPSDFGLHNVLVSPANIFCFIDFEYSGWDDPAKTICDFFLQPKIPISFTHFDQFSEQVASCAKTKEKTLERVQKMLPVCKIKWCCIILNVFLQTEQERRKFAKIDLYPARGIAGSQAKQLLLAQNYLIEQGETDQVKFLKNGIDEYYL